MQERTIKSISDCCLLLTFVVLVVKHQTIKKMSRHMTSYNAISIIVSAPFISIL